MNYVFCGMDSRDTWRGMALKELKTENLSQVQIWYGEKRYLDPVYFNRPYSEDAQQIPGFANCSIVESFEANDNKKLLNSLQEGLDSVFIKDMSIEDLVLLFKNVHADWLQIHVQTSNVNESEKIWKEYCSKRTIDWDKMNIHFIPEVFFSSDSKNVINRLSDLLDSSFSYMKTENRVYWNMEITDKQLETVAKCRSARILFQNLCDYLKKEVSLCIVGSITTKDDEYGSIRAPYQVLTAEMSGIDYLDISHASTDAEKIRLTRNTSFILNEESKMSEHSDPFQGSYFIEHMTHSFCKWAWEDFIKRV